MNKEYKKFKESELITGGLACLFLDLGCIVIDLTGVGIALSVTAKTFALGLIDWWIWDKGGGIPKIGKQVGKYFANFLPLATVITFFVLTFMHNHPKLTAVAGKAAGAIGKIATKAV